MNETKLLASYLKVDSAQKPWEFWTPKWILSFEEEELEHISSYQMLSEAKNKFTSFNLVEQSAKQYLHTCVPVEVKAVKYFTINNLILSKSVFC